MKSSDRTILAGVVLLGLVAAFWFMVLSPKRSEVSDLDEQIVTAEADLSQQQQLVAAGNAAKDTYSGDYQRLVVLGKAVPADDDAGSLFVEFDEIAGDSDVRFQSIVAAQGGEPAAAAPAALTEADAPAAGQAGAEATGGEPADPAAVAGEPTTAALPTESAAAQLPIGATVGSAGLPVIPYDLTLEGSFFGFADFFHGVDELVSTDDAGVANSGINVEGRLVTIDGFEITVAPDGNLGAAVSVTTYLTPPGQGITGGATPATPAATPVSSPAAAPSPAPTPTAAVAP